MAHPSLIVITGTADSRNKLDSSFDKVVQARPCMLIVDAALFARVAGTASQRYVLVGSTGLEIASVLAHLDEEKRWTRHDLVIAGCTSDRLQCALIRLLALQFGRGCAVLVARAPEAAGAGRVYDEDRGHAESAVRKLDAVLHAWSGEDGGDGGGGGGQAGGAEGGDVWTGDVQWGHDDDIVIAPGWDSDAKVRAVVEAGGLLFDRVTQEAAQIMQTARNAGTTRERPGEGKADGDGGGGRDGVRVKSWLSQHAQWKKKMELQRSTQVDEKGSKARARSQQAIPVQGNYFQRLLAQNKR